MGFRHCGAWTEGAIRVAVFHMGPILPVYQPWIVGSYVLSVAATSGRQVVSVAATLTP